MKVTLALDYRLKDRRPLRPLVDLLFIRRAQSDSLRRTLGASPASSRRPSSQADRQSAALAIAFRPSNRKDPERPCSSSKPPSSAPARWAARSRRSIAAADIPVVLKDVDQKFVDPGLEKAREVTAGPARPRSTKGKLTQEQADAQLERDARPHHRHHRLRRASATSTS